jgi:subtilisin family serine protease
MNHTFDRRGAILKDTCRARVARPHLENKMRVNRTLATIAVTCAAALGLLYLLGTVAGPSAASNPIGPLTEPISAIDVAGTVTYTTYLPFVTHAFELRLDPDDPSYLAGYQWGLETVRAPAAWYTTHADGVVVAIVDSGVDLSHPDLSGVLWTNADEVAGNGIDDDGNGYVDDVHGYDFTDSDPTPADANGHGTHVAGIATAATNNGVGIAGTGWGATIMPVRVLDAQGQGGAWDVMNGIYYATDNGARVINLSLGGYSNGCSYMEDAIDYAHAHGVLVVAAAGNDGNADWFDPSDPGNWFYPAACDGVLGVAATDWSDAHAAFSNYGSWVDVAAPGVGIYSTYWRLDLAGVYAQMSGTSMATPFVSGVAALVRAWYPSLGWEETATAIENGAEDLGAPGWDPYYGAGRLEAPGALASAGLLQAGVADPNAKSAPVPAPQEASQRASLDTARAPYRPGELLVRLQGTPSAAGLAASDVLRSSRAPGVYLIRVPAGQELAQAHALRAQSRVLDAQPNYLLSAAPVGE